MHGKLITILGPTASGKSSLAIGLAQKFNGSPRRSLRRSAGEIVSADSRQVYRGMDIGTGKVTPEEQAQVPHHLLDIVEPTDDFSLAHYQEAAFAAIDDIVSRHKTPFLVGGTALYIYSVIDNYNLTNVGMNLERRKELEKMGLKDLQKIIPPDSFNTDDYQNPRRLIRAIEKLEAGITLADNKKPPRYDVLILGIDVPREELYKKIDLRVDERIKAGMIEEVVNLRQTVPDEKLIGFGLEYRWITEYLQGKWTKEVMVERLKNATHAFARRQMTWWKRDQRIVWIKNQTEAQKAIKKFL